MRKRIVFTGLLLSAVLLSGCVSMPKQRISESIETGELRTHTEFLSQPRLRGRKTGSPQAKIARRYLSRKFERLGLVPWGQADSFVQDFMIGKNVIGVLPGSDPNLASEIVLVSAHYDHLGAGLFKMYPGACDNAAGVAALLEIAEKMSWPQNRPRRPVCFASFDAEEMGCLGAFAFTCRDDYDDSKIAAVVNIDLLGRDFLEVVDNSLLVVGAERFPALCEHIEQAAAEPNLMILPFETELVGPVGDHVAFLSPQRPAVFFTCGLYRDYHQPTDTADKLDFDKIRREAAVIYSTLDHLANVRTIEKPAEEDPPAPRTIQSLAVVLNAVEQNTELFRFDPNDLKTIQAVRKQVIKTAERASSISAAQRARIERNALKKLLPLLKGVFPEMAQNADTFLQMGEWFALYPQEFTAGYREIIRQGLAKKPSLLRKTVLTHKITPEPTDRDWAILSEPNGLFLACVQPCFETEAEYSLIGSGQLSFSFSFQIDLFRGPRNELVDYVMLKMIDDYFTVPEDSEHSRLPDSNDFSSASAVDIVLDPNCCGSFWNRIYQTIPRGDPNSAARPLLDVYFDHNDPNTLYTRWLTALRRSSNLFLAAPAVQTSLGRETEDPSPLWRSLLEDPNTHPQVRVGALYRLSRRPSRENLLAITRRLEDRTPCPPMEPRMMAHKNFPLQDHPLLLPFMPHLKKWLKTEPPKTLGRIAAETLRKQTKKNFGTRPKRWQTWIYKHYPE